MGEIMIEVRDLRCGYGAQFNLKEINLKVARGEVVGIIGPNGSGKTTLIRAMSRMLKPQKGMVFFEGKDVGSMGLKELAVNMAVVSQSADTAGMTVEEFVLLGRTPYFNRFQFLETKKDLESAEKAMRLTDIYKLKDRSMVQMSGGERQLALVARALAQEPKALLLDEPTTHLDIAHQVVILDLVKRLNKELGITIIVVLHDLNLASEYCERIVLMNEGRIYKVGSPEEVLTYQIIEAAYNTVVIVERNPISSKPYVLIGPEEERGGKSWIKKD